MVYITKILILTLTLALAGCSSVHKKVYSDKFEVVYSWYIYPKNPYCEFSDPPVIYIDTHYLDKLNAWSYLPDIVKHEEIHGQGLRDHCKKRWCLMHKTIGIGLFRLSSKPLCNDCRSKQ